MTDPASSHIVDGVKSVAETAVEHRLAWDRLDAAVGDGDFGSTLARGFSAVLEDWGGLDRSSDRAFLSQVGEIVGREMGGTSGPLWSVAFLRAGVAAGEREALDTATAAAMLRAAEEGISSRGGAVRGDKTLLDALVPMVDALESAAGEPQGVAAEAAVRAALQGAAETREMRARRGRAAYAGHRTIGAPDPGAVAIAVLAIRVAERFGVAVEEPGWLTRPGDSASGDRVDVPPTEARAVLTKKFVNDPGDAPFQALSGLAAAHAGVVVWDPSDRIVRRAEDSPAGQVGVVSGGGSGHEPLHAGFVGSGMLSAAAPGGTFASPSVEQILAATRAADRGAGVLQIVKNYTGDVMNFRLAAEQATAQGIEVVTTLVEEDVASSEADIGGRGTAAVLLVEKLAGARAEAGGPLEAVKDVADRAARDSATIGVALSACSLPGGGPLFELGEDEIEVGVGIHGELGHQRGPMRPADEIVGDLLGRLVDDLALRRGARVLAFVNGLGGTSVMELYVLYRAVAEQLAAAGFLVSRSLVGSYVTSLDMAGASITLLRLDEEMVELWDAPVCTPALRWGC